MEKRVLLAFILSTLILALWYVFFAPAPQPPTAPPRKPQERAQQKPVSPSASSVPSAPSLPAFPEREIRIETPLWSAVFTNRGAVARSWNIHHLPNGRILLGSDRRPLELIPRQRQILQALGYPLALRSPDDSWDRALQNATWAVSSEESVLRIGPQEKRELVFTLEDPARALRIQKRFTFFGDRYDFQLEISATRSERPLELLVGPNFGDQSIVRFDTYTKIPPRALVHDAEKVRRIQAEKPPKEPVRGPIKWAGLEDNYFALVAIPDQPAESARLLGHTFRETHEGEEIERHALAVLLPVTGETRFTLWAGPKGLNILQELDARLGGRDLQNIINYGFAGGLVRPIIHFVLNPALSALHRLTGNYGIGIIIVTLVLNLFFYPLRRSSTIRMRKASALQPKMRELQEKMKKLRRGDPKMQELQMEQIRLMKEANPLGGCLPLLLQLPIFWAMFILLTISLDVRHAPFLGWIDDLSSPDRWHILPILMCASMIASTLMTPTPQGDPSQRVQRFMMAYLMPILLTYLFFWRAPSGLVLYWMMSNLVGIGQQLLINRSLPPLPVSPEGASAKEPATEQKEKTSRGASHKR